MRIHMKLAKRIAKNLPKEMESKGISQTTLADMTGISRPYINQILSGFRQNLTLEIVEKLASALKVDPTRLMKE